MTTNSNTVSVTKQQKHNFHWDTRLHNPDSTPPRAERSDRCLVSIFPPCSLAITQQPAASTSRSHNCHSCMSHRDTHSEPHDIVLKYDSVSRSLKADLVRCSPDVARQAPTASAQHAHQMGQLPQKRSELVDPVDANITGNFVARRLFFWVASSSRHSGIFEET